MIRPRKCWGEILVPPCCEWTLSISGLNYRDIYVVKPSLPFESVDEILWCDNSNETSSGILLHGTICFSIYYKMKYGIFLEFWALVLLTPQLTTRVKRFKSAQELTFVSSNNTAVITKCVFIWRLQKSLQ